MQQSLDRRASPGYLLGTWTARSLFYFFMSKSVGANAVIGGYAAGAMWCSASEALLTCEFLGRPTAGIAWQWSRTRDSVAAAFRQFFGFGPLPRRLGIGRCFLLIGTIGVILNCATTLAEEFRWRESDSASCRLGIA